MSTVQNKVVHRFIKNISEYEENGQYFNQVIPVDTQAYAYYAASEDNAKEGLYYVIGDGAHTYIEIRDGKGAVASSKEYRAVLASDTGEVDLIPYLKKEDAAQIYSTKEEQLRKPNIIFNDYTTKTIPDAHVLFNVEGNVEEVYVLYGLGNGGNTVSNTGKYNEEKNWTSFDLDATDDYLSQIKLCLYKGTIEEYYNVDDKDVVQEWYPNRFINDDTDNADQAWSGKKVNEVFSAIDLTPYLTIKNPVATGKITINDVDTTAITLNNPKGVNLDLINTTLNNVRFRCRLGSNATSFYNFEAGNYSYTLGQQFLCTWPDADLGQNTHPWHVTYTKYIHAGVNSANIITVPDEQGNMVIDTTENTFTNTNTFNVQANFKDNIEISRDNSPEVKLKNENDGISLTPNVQRNYCISAFDKDDVNLGGYSLHHGTDNSLFAQLVVKNPKDTTKASVFNIGYDTNGNEYADASTGVKRSIVNWGSGTYALKSEIKKYKWMNVEVSVADWVDDTTYTDYPYKADIQLNNVTSDMIPEVVFSLDQITSGNYAPVCESGENIVTIYAKAKPEAAITIPSILCQ